MATVVITILAEITIAETTLDEESLSSPALPTIGIFDYNPKKQKQKNRWSISSIENDTNLASANERLKIIVKEQREALDKMSRDNLNLKHEIIRLQSILLATNKIQAPERPLPECIYMLYILFFFFFKFKLNKQTN